MNIVILLAIFVQYLIAKASRTASAIAGFLITTGILIWGLTVYADGDQIALFGSLALSLPVFIGLCVVWYAFDVKDILGSVKSTKLAREFLAGPLMKDEKVIRFYQMSQSAWSTGALNELSPNFVKESALPFEKFASQYIPGNNNALDVFFKGYTPYSDEYLVAHGNLDSDPSPGWFLLTSHRLVQKDGTGEFREVMIDDIDTYSVEKTKPTVRLTFKLKSGESAVFENVKVYPSEKAITICKNKKKLIA